MSSCTGVQLSELAQRALNMSCDRRVHVGDLPLRAGVLGRPSPADVVQLLDEAARGEGAGACRDRLGAGQLLQRLSVTPWSSQTAQSSTSVYVLDLHLLQAVVQLAIRRHPAPHVWTLG